MFEVDILQNKNGWELEQVNAAVGTVFHIRPPFKKGKSRPAYRYYNQQEAERDFDKLVNGGEIGDSLSLA